MTKKKRRKYNAEFDITCHDILTIIVQLLKEENINVTQNLPEFLINFS